MSRIFEYIKIKVITLNTIYIIQQTAVNIEPFFVMNTDVSECLMPFVNLQRENDNKKLADVPIKEINNERNMICKSSGLKFDEKIASKSKRIKIKPREIAESTVNTIQTILATLIGV